MTSTFLLRRFLFILSHLPLNSSLSLSLALSLSLSLSHSRLLTSTNHPFIFAYGMKEEKSLCNTSTKRLALRANSGYVVDTFCTEV
ncbi:hypothetical protein F5H01DRAFT_61276 [Linnemannia elongata]|nr:hypothetical protein F5H01DRAFT_61276 [Linnemannia elongata]